MQNQALRNRAIEEFWLARYEELSRESEKEIHELIEIRDESLSFSQEIHDKVVHLCNGSPILIYSFYSSVFAILLNQYKPNSKVFWLSGKFVFDDLSQVDEKDILLIHQLEINSTKTFKEIFRLNKENLLDAYNNQISDILDNLKVKNEQLVCLQFGFSIEGITKIHNSDDRCQFQILTSKEEGMMIRLHGAVPLQQLSPFFLQSYLKLLEEIVLSPNQKMETYKFIGEDERNQILSIFNPPINKIAPEKTILSLFKEQVLKLPSHPALKFEEDILSYEELDHLSNQFAHFLIENFGVGLGDFIGIELNRNNDLIIATIGTLKCGAIYVPIDTDSPQQRIDFIKTDSECVITIDSDLFQQFEISSKNYHKSSPDVKIVGDNLAYMIYTSGSTGNPKGVIVRHGALVNYNEWFINAWNEEAEISGVLTSSPAFDGVFTVIYGCLLNGGTLHLMTSEHSKDPEFFINYLLDNQISFIKGTPAFCELVFLNEKSVHLLNSSALKLVISGGDKPNINYATKIVNNSKVRLFNHYGPTETTIGSCVYEVKKDRLNQFERHLSIGKPISNTNIYILSESLSLQPIGVLGEMYIAGEGLADGYWNRKELTAEKFVKNPFHNGKMYKTGDLGRWLNDGNIEFVGRTDSQVKIRGYRIELGEIEKNLTDHPDIDGAIVTVVESKNGNELKAVLKTNNTLNAAVLFNYLANKLPDYMVPSFFYSVEEFPLTTNGKIDRQKLEKIGYKELFHGTEYKPPVTELEKKLVLIWQNVLRQEKIGVTDNFFILGGHSLKAIKLISEYQKIFGVKIRLSELFNKTTISEHSQLIESAEKLTFINIEKVQEADFYAVSAAQKRIWVLSQFESGKGTYNMSAHFSIGDTFDLTILNQSIYAIINRHESLRTVFREDENGEIWQRILTENELNFKVNYLDFRDDLKGIKSEEFIRIDAVKPFDLANGPLIRVAILEISNNERILYFNMHHIISDGWSMDVLSKEIFVFYQAFSRNEQPLLPVLKIQYKDYSSWQLKQSETKAFEKSRHFWLEELNEEWPRINLPSTKIRPKIMTNNGRLLNTFIQPETIKKLSDFSQLEKGSVYLTLLAVCNVLLASYTRQNDNLIGSPVAGREHPDLENQIGCYVNTIVLRNKINWKSSFKEFYADVKTRGLRAFEHQIYPFDKLINDLKVKNDPQRNAIFDLLFTFQSKGEEGNMFAEIPILTNEIIDLGEIKSKVDLEIEFEEIGSALRFGIKYNSDIYEKEMVESFMNHFKNLIEQVLDKPNQTLPRLNFLDEVETNLLLQKFNETQHEFPNNCTLLDLFHEQALLRENDTALVFLNKGTTFGELDKLSNQMANYLVKKYAIQPEDFIAVKLERSDWMVISILAVLKAGGAYVPIDPESPLDRVSYIENDCNCKVTIDSRELESFISDKDNYEQTNPNIKLSPNNLAYVIYTSGSTGKPKGCMLEHIGVVNRIDWMWNALDFKRGETVLQKTTCTFDVSVWELFLPICWGNKMVIAEKEDISNPIRIVELISQQQVNTIHFVPSMLKAFLTEIISDDENLNKIQSLKRIITSGEALTPDLANGWLVKTNIPIFNLYGPTEASIDVSYVKLESPKKEITIGCPIWNTSLFILGEEHNLVPIGAIGEICIAGVGLARGYLNQPELTAEKFINHPFLEGEKIYLTGDLGRWRSNGEIQYLGRLDDQIKIRGFRIELGEIEVALEKHKEIISAAVIPVENSENEKSLVAFYVAEVEINIEELREFLGQSLPDYMLPFSYLKIPEIPLTPNGKVNKKALAKYDYIAVSSDKYAAPETETEKTLVKIWENVLEIERLGVTTNFLFAGGDSIKALRLLAKINQQFKTNINIGEFYLNLTIKKIAKLIEENEPLENNRSELLASFDKLKKEVLQTYDTICGLQIEDVFPMSDIQKGMIFTAQLNKEKAIYHDQFIYQIPVVKANILTKALELMVNKHPILRTVFEISQFSEPVQIVHQTYTPEICWFDLIKLTKLEIVTEIQTYLAKNRENPFNLQKGPLWKISIFNISEKKSIFLLQFHHAILDGWSVASLNTELFQLYEKLKDDLDHQLTNLKSDYKEMVIQEIEYKADQNLANFWKNELENYKRVSIFSQTDERNYLEKYIDKDFFEALQGRIKSDEISLNGLLLGAFTLVLNNLTYENEVTIGLVMNTRPVVEDADKVLGCFLNTIPFRLMFDQFQSLTWKEYIASVDRKSREIRAKNKLSLFEITKVIGENKDVGNPIFDIIFNYVDFHIYDELERTSYEEELIEDSIGVKSYEETNTWLDFSARLYKGKLSFSYKLRKELQANVSIEQLDAAMYLILDNYLNNGDTVIDVETLFVQREEKENTEFIDGSIPTILQGFHEQVKYTPNDIALVFDSKEFSYVELDKISNQFAHYLTEMYGVGQENLVGVKLERNEWMVISMLAILKIGAAYVPIDIDWPADRIDYIEKDGGCLVSIGQNEINSFCQIQPSYNDEPILVEISSKSLAYVIYTSGSTGKPKGCMIEHAGLVNRIDWMWEELNFKKGESVLQKTAFTFDVSVWEFFLPLCYGNKMIMAEKDVAGNPEKICDLIEKYKVSTIHFVPSMLKAFLARIQKDEKRLTQLGSLKRVITSGEALSSAIVDQWYELKNIPIYNLYGPTEASIDVTYYLTQPNEIEVPIGIPIRNTNIHVLSKQLNQLPIGAIGEICVEGIGVARGYLNQPDLTKEKFVNSPFDPLKRIYRTGDLGRWREDGQLLYLGRIDHQVKIRGHRIELGEIENALETIESISAGVVDVIENDYGEKDLIAYYVSDDFIEQAELKNKLAAILPQYAVPSFFMRLDEIPLTTNGKVNRKKLPAFKNENSSFDAIVLPKNETEKTILDIFENVLNLKSLSTTSDFFIVGGDSIKALRLLSRLNLALDSTLDLSDLYEKPDVQNLAGRVIEKERSKRNLQPIYDSFDKLREEVLLNPPKFRNRVVEDAYPMTDIEKGMIFETLLSTDKSIYHDQFVYETQFDKFNEIAIRIVLEQMMEKHEKLRSGFNVEDYSSFTTIVYKTTIELPLKIVDLSDQNQTVQQIHLSNYLHEERKKQFDLLRGPLWRITIFICSPKRQILIFECHHAALDGWSCASFMTELNNFYVSFLNTGKIESSPLKTNFRTCVAEEIFNYENTTHYNFWRDELNGFKRLDIFSKEVVEVNHSKIFQEAVLNRAKDLARELDTSLQIICLSAYVYALSRITYENDITIGLVSNTRSINEDSDKVIGCFVNTLPFRIKMEKNETWKGLVKRVHLKVRELKTKDLTLIRIGKAVNSDVSEGNPFFDTFFNFIDFHIYDNLIDVGQQESNEFELTNYQRSNTYFDIDVVATDNKLSIGITQSRKLISGISVQTFLEIFSTILVKMTELPAAIQGESLSFANQLEYNIPNIEKNESSSSETSIIHAFVAQVKEYPNKIALAIAEKEFTYQELDEFSTHFACFLEDNYSINSEDLIGVQMQRDERLIITLLAVLKLGCAYVPIDLNYPKDRINYIIEDSGCKLILTSDLFESYEKLNIEPTNKKINRPISPNNLAYVIYTSGSTGKPKGVLVEHQNVMSFLSNLNTEFSFEQDYSIAATTNITFDISVLEIFGALCLGRKLMLFEDDDLIDPERFLTKLDEDKINVLQITPSRLQQLGDSFYTKKFIHLKKVLVGGEALKNEQYLALKKMDTVDTYNVYGPTETTIWSSVLELKKSKSLSIGKPLRNEEIIILNKNDEPLPIGVFGNLVIGGEGVTRGYHNRAELTKEKFIQNPHQAAGRLYKTGDLARWTSDGVIEYSTRLDDQVKIRGHRIELGEIENSLTSFEGVNNAVVVVKEVNDNQHLIAYYVSKLELEAQVLRNYLMEKLPTYMVPNFFIHRNELPINANGKINRIALKEVELFETIQREEYLSPITDLEFKLVAIWEEILGVEQVGALDDFFRLGGNSLSLVRLNNSIAREFKIRLELAELFEKSQLKEQATLIEIYLWNTNKPEADSDNKEDEEIFTF